MSYVFLMLAVCLISFQQVIKKLYSVKHKGGVITFTAASVVFGLAYFCVTSKEFNYTPELLWYSVAFSITYSLAVVGSILAIKTGPLSLSSLVTSYSLIIPTFYGIIVLGEPTKLMLYVGIVLLVISIFFVNMEKKGEEKKITLKWILCALLSFLANGACSTVQKVQQLDFNGLYKNESMIIALAISSVLLFISAFIIEGKEVKTVIKKGFWFYALCGVANAVTNYFTILLATRMPASITFPVLSAGGIVLAAIISVFGFKEKLSKMQWVGMILGIASIVALNL